MRVEDRYCDTTAFERFYDVMRRRICNEHDALSFADDKRAIYAEMLRTLSDEYDEFSDELAEDLKYFDVCGRFISDDIFDDEGWYKDEVIQEARNIAHTMPAYSDVAQVYWDYIDKRSRETEDD